MKYYFFSLLIGSSFLTAMEIHLTTDEAYEKIRDKIDVNHLGVNKHSCMRPIIGALYAERSLWNMQGAVAEAQLKKIESYISLKDVDVNEQVFQKLIQQHWYVSGLIDICVDHAMKKLKNVTGSTIDSCCIFYTEKKIGVVKKVIKKRAEENFFSSAHFMSSFSNIRKIELGEEGYAVNPFSIGISENRQYLYAKDKNNVRKIWDIQQAIQLDIKEFNNIQWDENQKTTKSFPCINTQFYDLYATNCTKPTDCLQLSRETWRKNPMIVVKIYQNPLLYACWRAYENSKGNKSELAALKESKSFKAMTFLKKNLEKCIDDQLNILHKT